MFHNESSKPLTLWVKRLKVKGHEAQKNSAGMGFCTPVSAGFF